MRFANLLAAACICAASTVGAQTEDPVIFYGHVFGMVESVEVSGGVAPAIHRTRVTDQATLIGVRGAENLGGGHAAWFRLETGFPVDSPGGFANRNSGVGFQGPWGTVVIGRWSSPFDATQVGSVDPFGDLGIADIKGAAINQGNFSRRQRNAVQYWSQRISGFRTRLAYAANEGRTASLNPYDYSVSFAYYDIVTFAALAFEKHKDQVGGTPTAGSDEEGYGVAGFHTIGALKIYGQYGVYRRTGTVKQNSYMIGLEAVHGLHALLASYQNSRNGGLASLPQPRCDLVAVGYRYRFTPKTFFIAEYARVNNKVGALCNFGTNPLSISAGEDLRGFAVGLRTVF